MVDIVNIINGGQAPAVIELKVLSTLVSKYCISETTMVEIQLNIILKIKTESKFWLNNYLLQFYSVFYKLLFEPKFQFDFLQ